jgi:hypothetical protein
VAGFVSTDGEWRAERDGNEQDVKERFHAAMVNGRPFRGKDLR